jgi:predicted phosphodiesterase
MRSEPASFGAPAEPVAQLGTVSSLVLISDVHGNAAALAAVLTELQADPPDIVVVNGDLSWGPEPEAALALADELPSPVFLRGNAESALLRLHEGASDNASETEAWMLARHTAERLDQIKRFSGAAAADVDGVGRVFVCHGSPRGDQELVTPETPLARMAELLAGLDVEVLVTAHVHLQFERRLRRVTSMNAGSVGLPYGATPAAYWARLGPGISLRQTAYDLEDAERRMRASGSPTADRFGSLLRDPPTAREVIEHGERLIVSD